MEQEQVINYVVKTELPKGAIKTVKVVEGKIGMTEFRTIAKKKMDMPSVAKVFVERTVDGEPDGNGVIMRFIRKEVEDGVNEVVVLPKGLYHKLDKAN